MWVATLNDMGIVHSGIRNPNWRGGRTITSHGYVLIRVGKKHHLSDVRGYAYEHRLVAEAKIGRRLIPGEQVHHTDGDKQNNRPENIEVKATTAHHRAEHRKPGSNLKPPDDPNPIVTCECGCGVEFYKYDATNRPRRFVSGHNLKKGGA